VRGRPLSRAFFARPAPSVAVDLLGKALCRRLPSGVVRAAIVETEAYHGPLDRASHAHRGRTPRNAVMFGPAGRWYVYLCYGVHWMLNVVTGRPGEPSAVLVRGVIGHPRPGLLTRALSVDRRLGGAPASRASGLWVEDAGFRPARGEVLRGPRVGVAYAGPEWAGKPWRFALAPRARERLRPSAT
jgi:DNA-3-methyladenine glycosylase